MIYFYTDLVAKAWLLEIGSGSPMDKVPGFASNLRARTPWGHCAGGLERDDYGSVCAMRRLLLKPIA